MLEVACMCFDLMSKISFCFLQALKTNQEKRRTAGTVQVWNSGVEAQTAETTVCCRTLLRSKWERKRMKSSQPTFAGSSLKANSANWWGSIRFSTPCLYVIVIINIQRHCSHTCQKMIKWQAYNIHKKKLLDSWQPPRWNSKCGEHCISVTISWWEKWISKSYASFFFLSVHFFALIWLCSLIFTEEVKLAQLDHLNKEIEAVRDQEQFVKTDSQTRRGPDTCHWVGKTNATSNFGFTNCSRKAEELHRSNLKVEWNQPTRS